MWHANVYDLGDGDTHLNWINFISVVSLLFAFVFTIFLLAASSWCCARLYWVGGQRGGACVFLQLPVFQCGTKTWGQHCDRNQKPIFSPWKLALYSGYIRVARLLGCPLASIAFITSPEEEREEEVMAAKKCSPRQFLAKVIYPNWVTIQPIVCRCMAETCAETSAVAASIFNSSICIVNHHAATHLYTNRMLPCLCRCLRTALSHVCATTAVFRYQIFNV